MGIADWMVEIEKKYLLQENGIVHVQSHLKTFYRSVDDLGGDVLKNGVSIQQGYLPLNVGLDLAKKAGMTYDFTPEEARLRDKGGAFYFTLKGKGGLVRDEEESKIPEDLFTASWPRTEGKRVTKVRLPRVCGDLTIEFDCYLDRDLAVAEVEFRSVEEASAFPPLGLDITEDKKYKNKNLAK